MAIQPEDAAPDYLPWSKHKTEAWRLLSEGSGVIPSPPDLTNFEENISFFAPLLEILIFGMNKDPIEGIEDFLVEYESGEISSWQVKWWGPALYDLHAWIVRESNFIRGTFSIKSDNQAKLPLRSGPYAELFSGGTDPFHLLSHSIDRSQEYADHNIKDKSVNKETKINADVIFQKYLEANYKKHVDELSEDEVVELILKFGIWMSIDSYIKAPWIARYALRKIRNRSDDRVSGIKQDLWGLPTEEGFFTDDNSLIKGTYRRMKTFGKNNPYGDQAIDDGFVCCHVWADTTKDPLLFSFVPNLIWLPKSLSKFTDDLTEKPPHKIHYILQNYSILRFKSAVVETGLSDVQLAWSKLPGNQIGPLSDMNFTEFISEPNFSNLVSMRHQKLLAFLRAAQAGEPYKHQRFSARYHLGYGDKIISTVPIFTELVSPRAIEQLIEIIEKTSPKSDTPS